MHDRSGIQQYRFIIFGGEVAMKTKRIPQEKKSAHLAYPPKKKRQRRLVILACQDRSELE